MGNKKEFCQQLKDEYKSYIKIFDKVISAAKLNSEKIFLNLRVLI